MLPILTWGNFVIIALVQFVLPRWIVTGPDRRRLSDIPRVQWVEKSLIVGGVMAVFLLAFSELPQQAINAASFAVFAAVALTIMLLERKYLPGTRRYLVTLCWFACITIWVNVRFWLDIY